MKRLIQTSVGPAMVDVDWTRWVGLEVGVTPFDSNGWEDGGRIWTERQKKNRPRETLEQFLAEQLRVPSDEAELLAADIVGPWSDEWERRGGKQDVDKVARLTLGFVAILSVVLVLAALGIALLVWVVAS